MATRAERDAYAAGTRNPGYPSANVLIAIANFRIAMAEDDAEAMQDAARQIAGLKIVGAARLTALGADLRVAVLQNDPAAYATLLKAAESETERSASLESQGGDRWRTLASYVTTLAEAQEETAALTSLHHALTLLDRADIAAAKDEDDDLERSIVLHRASVAVSLSTLRPDADALRASIERLRSLPDIPIRSSFSVRAKTLWLAHMLFALGRSARDDAALKESRLQAGSYLDWLTGRIATSSDLPAATMRAFESLAMRWQVKKLGEDSACVARADTNTLLARITIAEQELAIRSNGFDRSKMLAAIETIDAMRKRTGLQRVIDRPIIFDDAIAWRLLASVEADPKMRAVMLAKRTSLLDTALDQTRRCFCAATARAIVLEQSHSL